MGTGYQTLRVASEWKGDLLELKSVCPEKIIATSAPVLFSFPDELGLTSQRADAIGRQDAIRPYLRSKNY